MAKFFMLTLRVLKLAVVSSWLTVPAVHAADESVVVVGGTGADCIEDPGCVNRLHPDIPMVVSAEPGQTILFHTRDARDALGASAQQSSEPDNFSSDFGRVHPITGPVYISGASAGDVLKVTIVTIEPGPYAWSTGGSSGFVPGLVDGQSQVIWRLNRNYAETDDIPGVRIPNSSFPGIITTLPGRTEHRRMLEREQALAEAGGRVSLPLTDYADPEELCGPGGAVAQACLRTIPPREHGGNMDIRYLQAGVSVYLPCFIDGCGLAIGDLHYAQGDGEVSGTAIEMSADVWVTTELLNEGPDLSRGPHYEGSSTLLDIPSRRFYAVTGIPVKNEGEIPPDMQYLQSDVTAGLANLSNDINLAARNAVSGIVDYIVKTYGYNRQQAYIIASVAVDLRIAQLVDAPNVGVTAILPLDIFNQN